MHCLHSVFVRIRRRELGEKKRVEGGGGGGVMITVVWDMFQEK